MSVYNITADWGFYTLSSSKTFWSMSWWTDCLLHVWLQDKVSECFILQSLYKKRQKWRRTKPCHKDADVPHFVWGLFKLKQDKTSVLNVHARSPFLAANTVEKSWDGSYRGPKGEDTRVWAQIVWSSHGGSAGLLHVGLEEHRWRRRAWQVSQTLTGFGEAGRGSSLSEQLLQKISPQFLQWCWKEREQEPKCCCCLVYRCKLTAVKSSELTFRLEMENSFSHSLQWLASLSFNQTWPPWNKKTQSLFLPNFTL